MKGKTTTINMLTELLPPDYLSAGDAYIYGYSVLHEMDEIRHSMVFVHRYIFINYLNSIYLIYLYNSMTFSLKMSLLHNIFYSFLN